MLRINMETMLSRRDNKGISKGYVSGVFPDIKTAPSTSNGYELKYLLSKFNF